MTILKRVLVTGAAGYVGNTLVRELLAQGIQVAGYDSLERGHFDALPAGLPFLQGDVRDAEGVRLALELLGERPDAVIHLAALIQVGESVSMPERYLHVNHGGTEVVAEACANAGVPVLVLASSAAVLSPEQGGKQQLGEDAAIAPESPYGLSKWRAEQTLAKLTAQSGTSTVALRFFNIAGAIGSCAERHDPETHLIPLAVRAAWKELPALKVFAANAPTPDGTCLRDYLHVRTVVQALQAAAEYGMDHRGCCEVVHVGSGVGTSVRQVVNEVERVLGLPVPRTEAPPREGDVAFLVADSAKMTRLFGLTASTDLAAMVRDCAEALRTGRPVAED